MDFQAIHNYYEQLVIENIQNTLVAGQRIDDPHFLEEVACLALNQLPPRYMRRGDGREFLPSKERQQIEHSVGEAVRAAATFVARYRGKNGSSRLQ